MDDFSSVLPAQIPQMSLSLFWETISTNHSGPLGRPLPLISFILNHWLWGPETFSYKIVNLALHLFNGLLITHFLKKLMPGSMLAYSVSLLWLIHPLQISTVLYVVQRMTELSAFFMLIGCIAYLKARLAQQAKYYGVALLALPLALACKETGILLTLYYPCIEWLLAHRSPPLKPCPPLFIILGTVIPLLLTTLYCLFQWPVLEGRYETQGFTLLDRLYTEPVVVWTYLKQLLTPHIATLGLFQDDVVVHHALDLPVLLALGAQSLLVFIAYKIRLKKPLLFFGLLWFYSSHALESTFLPLELVFEHRNYLASLGFLIGLFSLFMPTAYPFITPAQAGVQFNKQPPSNTFIGHGFLCLWGLLLLFLTHTSVQSWRSTETFIQQALRDHPRSARAHINQANLLIEQRRFLEALGHLERARQLAPYHAGIPIHMMLLYCHASKIPPALAQEAQQAQEEQAITPYSLNALRQLAHQYRTHQCPALSQEQLLSLLTTAFQNSTIQTQSQWLHYLHRELEQSQPHVAPSPF